MDFTQQSAKLSTGNLTFHVAGSGRPLLYLHSAGGVRFTKPLAELAKVNQVFVPVMPGFDGTETHPGIATMRDLANLAAEFIATVIDGEAIDVIGHSFGGRAAAWLAVDHPKLVGELVLECPSGFRPPTVARPSDDPKVVHQQMFAHPEKLPANEKSPQQAAANRKAAAAYHKDVDYESELAERLRDIQSLTLVLAGTLDGRVPVEAGYLLCNRIPDCHLVYIYDAAHNIEVDQPDRFAIVVRSFLDRGKAFIVNWGEHGVAGIDANVTASANPVGREALSLDGRDHVHF
jgi:pimeloyl-ACP methyl ester carboxylesterase